MAILKKDNLIVEINFTKYEFGWVYYAFRFFMGSSPIFNPDIYDEDFFPANEHRNDSLIPTLEEALDNNKSTTWQPTEPDMWIEVEFYRKKGLKDSQSNKNVVYISSQEQERLNNVDKLREESGGKLTDDCFQLTFFIDAFRLKSGIGGYSSDGIALRIIATRQQLQDFINELKNEYKEFLDKNKNEVKKMNQEAGLQSPL